MSESNKVTKTGLAYVYDDDDEADDEDSRGDLLTKNANIRLRLAAVTAERDAARAEVERLKAEIERLQKNEIESHHLAEREARFDNFTSGGQP